MVIPPTQKRAALRRVSRLPQTSAKLPGEDTLRGQGRSSESRVFMPARRGRSIPTPGRSARRGSHPSIPTLVGATRFPTHPFQRGSVRRDARLGRVGQSRAGQSDGATPSSTTRLQGYPSAPRSAASSVVPLASRVHCSSAKTA
ncbi:uncharacterized protein PSFLO_07741 [Pseudozyma flocculosa]|uniref:Uncharacterized protein n=1 Tax=Pseudozyma flocculosa TaxID=84751 RepID=A0A5C3FD26_9BASI|nr:uncharacterized protein PSFLO_07741 [Pseudozyma flocculosa]